MKEVDWRIVKELEYDARRSLADVADSLGTSLRTVERRLDFMKAERAAYIMGTPVYRNIVGVVCNFLVFSPDDDKKRELPARLCSKEHASSSSMRSLRRNTRCS